MVLVADLRIVSYAVVREGLWVIAERRGNLGGWRCRMGSIDRIEGQGRWARGCADELIGRAGSTVPGM